MLFLINVVIAVATFWNAAEDHSKAYSDFRDAVGAARAKLLRKFVLLWIIPLLSVLALPLTWSDQTASERKISELRKQAAQANERAEKANLHAAESNFRAAKLELAAAEIEMAMAPRVFRPKAEAFERLKQFSGTKFMVVSKPDPDNPYSREISNLSSDIFLNLSHAGWLPVTNVTPSSLEWFSDGVLVESNVGMAEEMKAAWALEEILGSKMIAKKQATMKHPGAVVILVGSKPNLPEIRVKKLSDDFSNSRDREGRREILDRMDDAMR